MQEFTRIVRSIYPTGISSANFLGTKTITLMG